MRLTLCLSGFGNIGRHFIALLQERRPYLLARHGLDLQLVAITGSSGSLHDPAGIDLAELLALPPGSEGLARHSRWSPGLSGAAAISASTADILVEATPTDSWSGQPGLDHFQTALRSGMDIVSFTKGPLVAAYTELMTLAQTCGKQIKASGATGAALPTLDTGIYCLAGDDLLSFCGILNGTSNYILTQMAGASLSYQDALEEAIRQGVAEPNPRLDIEGWDTASKAVILANSLFRTAITLAAVPVEGIQNITRHDIVQAKSRNQVIKLIAQARQTPSGVNVTVAPEFLSVDHPLAALSGMNKGIVFTAAALGEIVVSGGRSDPKGTEAAALKDIINLARERGWISDIR